MSAEIIELAKDGVKIHQPNNPEYIVCAELLRVHELNHELVEALRIILENDGGEGSKCYHAIKLYEARESAKVVLARVTREKK